MTPRSNGRNSHKVAWTVLIVCAALSVVLLWFNIHRLLSLMHG
ncbi:MAG: hypothetical protein WBA31_05920 [Candidatus Dormiibacterota bacterium]